MIFTNVTEEWELVRRVSTVSIVPDDEYSTLLFRALEAESTTGLRERSEHQANEKSHRGRHTWEARTRLK